MGKRDEQRKLLLCIKKKMHQFSGQSPDLEEIFYI
jgi:hypothetical protein